MANKRKKYSAEEKVRLLRLHLLEKEPVSDICDRHEFNPNVFYRWQKQFFENGPAAFDHIGNGRKDSHTKKLEKKISQLQAKLPVLKAGFIRSELPFCSSFRFCLMTLKKERKYE